jgi:hypothetical protein
MEEGVILPSWAAQGFIEVAQLNELSAFVSLQMAERNAGKPIKKAPHQRGLLSNTQLIVKYQLRSLDV